MGKSGVLLILLCLWYVHPAFSQGTRNATTQPKVKGSVRGKVVDSAGKQILSDATVSVTPETDTTETEYTVADKNGNFSFRNLSSGNYHLMITFEGYHHIIRRFTINAASKDIDFSTINMQHAQPTSCRKWSSSAHPCPSKKIPWSTTRRCLPPSRTPLWKTS
jgi:hypothetical protein